MKPAPHLPASLQTNRRLSQWLRFLPDNSIEVRSGKVEIGQGIATALAQIAAEELDVPVERIRMVAASTAGSPDENVTSGSRSIQDSGTALRYACAEARAIYLEAAAARLGVPSATLTVTDGEIVGADGARSSYGALADDALLEREATASAPPKDVVAASYRRHPAARASISRKKSTASRVSSTTSNCPACCTRGCCGRLRLRRCSLRSTKAARAPSPAWWRWCATAASSACWPSAKRLR